MVHLRGVHIEAYVSDATQNPPTVIAQGWTEAEVMSVAGTSSSVRVKCDLYSQVNLGNNGECGDRGGFVDLCTLSLNLLPSDVGRVLTCPVQQYGSCNRGYYTRGGVTVMESSKPAIGQTGWSGGCASAQCGISGQ